MAALAKHQPAWILRVGATRRVRFATLRPGFFLIGPDLGLKTGEGPNAVRFDPLGGVRLYVMHDADLVWPLYRQLAPTEAAPPLATRADFQTLVDGLLAIDLRSPERRTLARWRFHPDDARRLGQSLIDFADDAERAAPFPTARPH